MSDVKNKQILALIKFNEQKYIKLLYERGQLYMNEISYFKKTEAGSQRLDKDENLTRVLQPRNTKIVINGENISDKIVGSVKEYSCQDDKEKFTHVFCMSSINIDDGINEDGKIFDERIREFGDTMVIIFNIKEFWCRLHKKLSELLENEDISLYKIGAIDYVDGEKYHGKMDCFCKFNQFAWQKEHRLAISLNDNIKGGFKLEIGDIKSISTIVDVNQFKNSGKIIDGRLVINI